MQPTGIPLPGPPATTLFISKKICFPPCVFVVPVIGGARTVHKACCLLFVCCVYFYIFAFFTFFPHWTHSHAMFQLFFVLNWECLCGGTGGNSEELRERMMHGRLLSFSSLVSKSFRVPLSRCCGLVVVTSFWLLVLRQHAGITATLTHVHFLEMWPEGYGVHCAVSVSGGCVFIYWSMCWLCTVALFFFTWGFQTATQSILETQATVSQVLCMGLRWEVLPVSVWMLKSFLAWQMRPAGFSFLFLIIFCRMVVNERPTTCSTPFHLHLQSISKLNGYRWSPHNCLAFVLSSSCPNSRMLPATLS